MTTVALAEETTRDPRDPQLRMARLLDEGSCALLHEPDGSGACGARGTMGERDPRADPQAPGRTPQRLPAALLELAHHEQLDGGVLALEGTQKPCGDDPALVHHHAVAGAQPPRQI